MEPLRPDVFPPEGDRETWLENARNDDTFDFDPEDQGSGRMTASELDYYAELFEDNDESDVDEAPHLSHSSASDFANSMIENMQIRGKMLRRPNSRGDIRREIATLEQLEQRIMRHTSLIFGKIKRENRLRIRGKLNPRLFDEHPHFKKVQFLRHQLKKTQKQLLKLRIQRLSGDTQQLVRTMTNHLELFDSSTLSDIMVQNLLYLVSQKKNLDGASGYPNLQNRLLQTRGKVRRYLREDAKAIRAAFRDDESHERYLWYDDFDRTLQAGESDWSSFCGDAGYPSSFEEGLIHPVDSNGSRHWFNISPRSSNTATFSPFQIGLTRKKAK